MLLKILYFYVSGAGMFVTTVVVGVVSFISTVTLKTRPFTRDVLFYLGAVSWTFITLYKENITLEEAIGATNVVPWWTDHLLLHIGLVHQHWLCHGDSHLRIAVQ